MNVRRVRQLAGVAVVVAFAALLAGCGAFGGDQNTFNPSGDVAQRKLDLFIFVLIPAPVILILVLAVMLYILVRYRRRSDA